MSVIYRDRDRYDDSRTSISTARRGDGGYTTVKRYVVKEDDSRSAVGRDRRFVPERGGERVEETRIVRRERDVEEPIRETRREEPRYATEELVIRRDRDDESRRDFGYRRPEASASDRELVIRRTTERDDPRREVRDDMAMARYDDRRDFRVSETRYRDDYEVASPRGFEDRDLQRYSRNVEYYSPPPPPPPQTIVIRQEPIIIRERIRDDDYQIVRKSDVDEERSIVRREPDRPRGGEEEYFYEKRIRERIDEDDRRSFRREISPHDSVSQVGARRRGDDYSSDDSMVYVRRTREVESREGSPDRRKNLAAGVIAGIGAAELLRNHKEKEGRDVSHGAGRIGRDVGAGALGAIAAEGISRARSKHRSRSRRRSRSRSRRRSRSSSSGSRSRLKTMGAVGLGAAALAAAAVFAQKRMNKQDDEGAPGRGRSTSRNRHESVAQLANDPTAEDARNPKHRNIRMAEAGAAGAAVTALIDRARSKSRAREGRDRSQSRVRQAVPVIVGGLGSAALAGLYEKNKAKKEAEAIKMEERRRSRSRPRHGSDYYDGSRDGTRDGTVSDPYRIEYGDGPMHGNNFGAEYYGRPPPQEGFYGPQTTDVVPVVAGAAAGYGAAREARSRSRSLSRDRRHQRSLSRGSSSSGGGRRRRRDRSTDIAAAPAAGVGGAALSEREQRKQEKRERKARRRQQEAYGRDPYEDAYNPTPQPFTPTPPPAADPYANQPGYYGPQTSQFPPPPGAMPQQYPPQTVPQAGPSGAYNPQDFPPPPQQAAPAGMPGYDAYGSGTNPYAPRPRGPDNVSVLPNPVNGNSFPQDTPYDQPRVVDGVNGTSRNIPPNVNIQPTSNTTAASPWPSQNRNVHTPPSERSITPTQTRSASQPPPTGSRKSVQFAAVPEVQAFTAESEASSPEQSRRRHRDRTARGYEAGDDTDSTPDELRRRSSARGPVGLNPDDYPNGTGEDGQGGERRRRHHRRRSHDPSSSSSARPTRTTSSPDRAVSPTESDATVDLPARFDRDGKKKPEPGDDPLANKIDEILQGKGTAGKLFGNFMGGLFGPDGRRKGSSSGRVDDRR